LWPELLRLRVLGLVPRLWVPVPVREQVEVRLVQVRRRVLLLCLSKRPSGPAVPSWQWAKFQ
jgi:hypothetical protein